MKLSIFNFGYTVFVAVLVSWTVQAERPTGEYKKVVDEMRKMESQWPQFVSVFSIGDNDDGVEIYALRISTSPSQMDPSKVGHLVVSTHHGNETAAPVFTMAYANDLLDRYNSDEIWRGRLGNIEWTIIPVLNISGFNAGRRYEHGRDSNRDYPGPCNSSGGRLKSVQRMMHFLTVRPFSGTVTVHGYVGTLTFPWGVYANGDETLDHNFYAQATKKAAEINGYRHGTHTEIVYPANGTYEDYTYWKHGLWTLLLELRNGSANDIALTVPAIAKFFDQLDSTASSKNQFTFQCDRRARLDLRRE